MMQQINKNQEEIVPVMQQNRTFISEVKGTQYTYYLTGHIGEPDEYIDLCNILRNAYPQDEVVVRINSRGGSVASERMIINAIRECQANVVGFIEYDCMSAATGIFLACSEHQWAEHIQCMIHTSSWGTGGKTLMCGVTQSFVPTSSIVKITPTTQDFSPKMNSKS